MDEMDDELDAVLERRRPKGVSASSAARGMVGVCGEAEGESSWERAGEVSDEVMGAEERTVERGRGFFVAGVERSAEAATGSNSVDGSGSLNRILRRRRNQYQYSTSGMSSSNERRLLTRSRIPRDAG
jgi:hypothetical protein